jgi:hypothetical protein
MIISRIAGVPLPRVPVSTAETRASINETKTPENGPESSGLHIYELAEAINCLIDAGYKLGCDGELLPPKWAYEAFKGADA